MDNKLQDFINREDCYFIHYASNGFYSGSSPAPKISCIVIYNLKSDKGYRFNIADHLEGNSKEEAERLTFENLISSPHSLLTWMGLTVLISFCVCFPGLKSSVERITKIMMTCLLIIMFVLAVRSLTLDGSDAGLKFYLQPDFEKLKAHGIGEALYAALGQAFFTLSVGMGSMAIFGSYISKNKSLTGESLIIAGLENEAKLGILSSTFGSYQRAKLLLLKWDGSSIETYGEAPLGGYTVDLLQGSLGDYKDVLIVPFINGAGKTTVVL